MAGVTQALAATLSSRTRSTVFRKLFRRQEGIYIGGFEGTAGIYSRWLLAKTHPQGRLRVGPSSGPNPVSCIGREARSRFLS